MTKTFSPGSISAWSQLLVSLSWCGTPRQRKALLSDWMQQAPAKDRLRAIRWLMDQHPKKLMARKALLALQAQRNTLPEWLREQSLQQVPDAAEAIALLEHTDGRAPSTIGLDALCSSLELAKKISVSEREAWINLHWNQLDQESLFQFNRLVSGTASSPMDREEWMEVIASLYAIPLPLLSLQLQQIDWFLADPDAPFDARRGEHLMPFPFPVERLTIPTDDAQQFHASVHWDMQGIDVQLVKRQGIVAIWDRSFLPLQDQYPSIVAAASILPEGTVAFGRIISSGEDDASTQLLIMDLWEWQGLAPDRTLAGDRLLFLNELEGLDQIRELRVATPLAVASRDELAALHRRARLAGAAGLMMLEAGHPRKDEVIHHRWPAEPFRIKAVLLYAQRGDGVNGPQYSFALARGKDWVTVARTGEGLDEKERADLENFIKANTLQRFGPVRTVNATQVMELSVDNVRASTRHKSGYVLEGVRILAWRKDLGTEMADDILVLKSMAP